MTEEKKPSFENYSSSGEGNKDIYIVHGGDISQPSGGSERITAFTNALAEEEFDVTLIVPRPSSNISERLTGINIVTVPVSRHGLIDQPLRAGLLSQRATNLVEKNGGTLQIAQSSLAGVATLFGASDYVLDMHDIIYPQDIYGDLILGTSIQKGIRRLEGRAVRHARHVIVVSNSLQEAVHQHWDIPKSKISVIPNGYNESAVKQFQSKNRIPGRVVFLGEIHDKVDLGALINIAKLKDTEELVIIGKGDFFSKLEKGLDSVSGTEITLTGWLPPEKAFEIVSTATAAVAPYHQSFQYNTSSPVKLYAYAGLGVPIVVSQGPDFTYELADKEAAILVKDNREFANHVETVLRNENTQQALAENAVALSQVLTWEERGRSLTNLYRGVL